MARSLTSNRLPTRRCALAALPSAVIADGVGPKVIHDTAAPTGNTWRRGDVCWNSTPASGAPPGWVCTTGGTPGTWKAMANLA